MIFTKMSKNLVNRAQHDIENGKRQPCIWSDILVNFDMRETTVRNRSRNRWIGRVR